MKEFRSIGRPDAGRCDNIDARQLGDGSAGEDRGPLSGVDGLKGGANF